MEAERRSWSDGVQGVFELPNGDSRSELIPSNGSKVPTEEFSLYHIDGVASKSTTIKALNGPTVVIITNVSSSAGKITQTVNGGQSTVGDVKVGQVFLIGAGTQVEFSQGLEVWGSFWDDQEQEQTGTA